MEDKEKLEDVPFYIHEAVCDKIERAGKSALEKLEKNSANALSTMDKSNKRMLAALIAVCVTLLIAVFGFLNAYKVMTKTWVGFIDSHFNETVEEERGEDDGLFIQGDTTNNQGSLKE